MGDVLSGDSSGGGLEGGCFDGEAAVLWGVFADGGWLAGLRAMSKAGGWGARPLGSGREALREMGEMRMPGEREMAEAGR